MGQCPWPHINDLTLNLTSFSKLLSQTEKWQWVPQQSSSCPHYGTPPAFPLCTLLEKEWLVSPSCQNLVAGPTGKKWISCPNPVTGGPILLRCPPNEASAWLMTSSSSALDRRSRTCITPPFASVSPTGELAPVWPSQLSLHGGQQPTVHQKLWGSFIFIYLDCIHNSKTWIDANAGENI